MSEYIHEEEVNIRLSDMLNNLGLDCRPKRVRRHRLDIRCFHNGLIISTGVDAL
ncbi:MAG: hypothetical protein ACP5NQ_02895 [Vulcanisaeta sp.]